MVGNREGNWGVWIGWSWLAPITTNEILQRLIQKAGIGRELSRLLASSNFLGRRRLLYRLSTMIANKAC
jgi:hypothetical protein